MRSVEMIDLLKRGRAKELNVLVTEELALGVTAKDILNGALMVGMSEIGERFKRDEIYIPEVLIAARAMNSAIKILKPYLIQSDAKPLAIGIICTVQGDLHDIGKNIVKIMMEGVGISMIDLGTDVSADQVVEAIKEHNADLVCLSSLLTTTMPYQKVVIDAIKEAGLRDKVKIMVGGAPVTQEFADEIGADAYTPDAGSAAQVAKGFFI